MKKQLRFVTKATNTAIANGEHYIEAGIKYPIYIDESEDNTKPTVDNEEEGKETTYDPSNEDGLDDIDPQW